MRRHATLHRPVFLALLLGLVLAAGAAAALGERPEGAGGGTNRVPGLPLGKSSSRVEYPNAAR